MEFTDVLEHALQNDDFWYTDPKLGRQKNTQDLIGPYSVVSDFCKKYDAPYFGVFNLAASAALIRELKFLKMRGVITVEKMVSLYKMAFSADYETQKLAENMITNLMEKTK